MGNKILKLLIFITVVFSSFFLFNINEVKADCLCYYRYQSSTDTNNNYVISVTFAKNKVTPYAACQVAYGNIGNVTFDSDGDIIGSNCTALKITTVSSFDTSGASKVVNADCSVSACEEANLCLLMKKSSEGAYNNKLSSKSSISGMGCNENMLSGTKVYSLTAVTKEEADSASTADELENATQNTDLQAIIDWGDKATSSLYSVDDSNPCAIIDDDLKDLIETVLIWISIAGIVLLLIMSIIEFVKALTSNEAEGKLQTAFRNTLIRIACVVILLLLPMLISALIDAVNDNNVYREEDGSYMIGSEEEGPLCKINK